MVDNTPLKPTRDWLKSTRLNYKKRQENWILLALFGHEKQLYDLTCSFLAFFAFFSSKNKVFRTLTVLSGMG
jgi:hypothetical protein